MVAEKIGQEIIDSMEPAQEYLRFVIRGTTPMLQHNPAGSMVRDTPGSVRGRSIPSAEDEAEAGTYRLPDGGLCVPAVAVRNCILSGAKGLRVGRRAARPFVSGSLLLADQFFPLLTSDGEQITTFELDIQRAVVQRQGIMRARPRIDPPWYVAGSFLYNPVADIEVIRTCLDEAGKVTGLLDYRIEKGGPYGGFRLEELEIVGSLPDA